MRTLRNILLFLLLAASANAATINCVNPCLEPEGLANAQAHFAANSARWIAFKAHADASDATVFSTALACRVTASPTYCNQVQAKMWRIIRQVEKEMRIVSVSLANPAEVTTQVATNLVGGETVWIMGATGDWAGIVGDHIVTVTGPTTFTIPIDTTSYMGAFPATDTALIGTDNLDTSGDYFRNGFYYVPLAFHYARDQFTGDALDAMVKYLELEILYDINGSNNGVSTLNSQAAAGGNRPTGHILSILAAIFAIADDWPEAQARYDFVREKIGSYSIPNFTGYPTDGGVPHEGWEYGRQATRITFKTFVNIEAATGEDLWDELESWPDETLDYALSSISPVADPQKGSYYWGMYGDVLVQNQRTYANLDREMMLEIYNYFQVIRPDATRASYALYWLNNMFPAYTNSSNEHSNVMKLPVSLGAAVDWRTGTNLTQHYAPGMGMATDRSSWAADANFLLFFSGISGLAHKHNNSGSFDWYRGSARLSTAAPGYGAGYGANNSITNGPQVGVSPYINGPINDSGENLLGQDVVERYRAVSGISTYMRVNSTPHWQRVASAKGTMPEVDLIRRDFLYLNPNLVFLFARYDCDAPGCYAIDNFQTETAPTIAADRISITNGANKLFINGVYPADLNYVLVDNQVRHIISYRKSNPALLLMDSVHAKPDNNSFTLIISGATDECTWLNGTWAAFAPQTTTPNNGFARHSVTIPYDATSETCDMSDQNVETDLQFAPAGKEPQGDRVNVASPTLEVGATYRLYVYESGDGSAVASTVTALTNLTNAIGAQIGDQVVACRTGDSETASLVFNFTPTGTATVRICGNTPSTGYARSVVGSTFTLTSPGADVTSDSAGVIITDDTGGTPTPSIGLAPSSFTFNATESGANPATQNLSITNLGGGSLGAWTAAGSQAWLTCAPASGTDDAPCAVTIDTTGLADMTYNETLTVTAAAASNSPQVVNVTLVLNPAPVPTIAATPTSLAFMAALGDMDPTDTVAIDGGAVALSSWDCVITAGVGLEVSPLTGIGNATLTFTWVLAGLTSGTYNGNGQCTDITATNTPFNIPVTLELTGTDPILSVNVGNPSMDSQTNAGRTQIITVTNTGGFHADWAWTVTPSAECGLTASPETGATGEPFTITADPPVGVKGRCIGHLEITDNYGGFFDLAVEFTVRRFLPLRIGP